MSPCSGTPRRASIARVASQPDGRFVVVWSSDGQDGSSLGVLAQLYDPTGAPDGMASTGFGLQGLIDDTTGLYVQDDSPSDEDRYHARFYFDPNGFDPEVGQGHLRMRVFLGFEEAPMRRLFTVVVRREAGGQYSLMGTRSTSCGWARSA